MAKKYGYRPRKRRRLTNVATRDMGSAGTQIRIGKIESLDVQSMAGYLHNVRLSVNLNDSTGTGNLGGWIAYLSTNTSWSDDDVITARANKFGGTVNLSCKRSIPCRRPCLSLARTHRHYDRHGRLRAICR